MSIGENYDRVRYPNTPHARAHPARLAAIARLHGVPAASPARCRVLEVGCSEGNNLLPMAAQYPESTFLGVDLSAVAVARGEARRAELGLTNVELRAADLRSVRPADGPFDYVLARGFFSWVPEDVRLALLDLCGRTLAPTGVAFISYNTLPGWHICRMFREMMLAHVGDATDPVERVELGRGLLQFLAAGSPAPPPLGDLVKTEATFMLGWPEGVLYHDELAGINEPYYVSAFADLASRFGLGYLADVDYFAAELRGLPAGVRAVIEHMDAQDPVMGEQYRDFLHLRRYRQTLLVRADAPLIRAADPTAVPGFAAHGELRPEAAVDYADGVPAKFVHPKGAGLRVERPLAKAGLAELADRAGVPATFGELVGAAVRRLGRTVNELRPGELGGLSEALLDGFKIGLLTFAVDPPRWAAAAGDRPRACPLVRAQLRAGEETVTNRRHAAEKLDDPYLRALVAALDGTRDRAALEAAVGGPADRVEAGLTKAAELALLVG